MARWITFDNAKLPWDFKWPNATAYTAVTPRKDGKPHEVFVKDELADAAVKEKVAVEGKASQKATKPKKSAKKAGDAASDERQRDDVGSAGLPADGGPDDSAPVADAG